MSGSTVFNWANSAVSGAYTTAGDWMPASVPTYAGGLDALVYVGGAGTTGTANFTVTSSASEQVGYLNIGANATFAISGGIFLIESVVSTNVTYANLTNAGKVTVAAGSSLHFGVAGGADGKSALIGNAGSITVAGSISLATEYCSLFGAGTLNLTGSILGANTGSITYFKNDDSTIQGSGTLGNGALLQLTNSYKGIIDANAAAALTINTGANLITNAGTIETTGAGGLVIRSQMQLDGKLEAVGKGVLSVIGAEIHGGGQTTVAASAAIALNNGELSQGGAITIAAGGAIRTTTGNTTGVAGGNALVGDVLNDGEIEDSGSIVVTNNSTLNLNASIYNSGLISVAGSTGPTKLEVFGNGLSIYNTGGVELSNSAENSIVSNGAAQAMSVYSRIIGAGTIGDGWLRLVVRPGAIVEANYATALVIEPDTNSVSGNEESENYNDGTVTNVGAGGLTLAGGTFNNSGYLTEDGTGALTLAGVSIDNGGGFVRALVGKIVLQNNAQIFNEAYVSLAAGTILQTSAGDVSDAIYDNMYNSGSVNVTAGSTLIVDGHWSNAGAVNIGSASAAGTIEVAANNTWQLFGGGTVDMANAGDRIVGAGEGTKIEVRADTITGGGTIGDSSMEVDVENGGEIDATLAGGMTITAEAENQSVGQTFLYNAGIIQSDSAAGVTLTSQIYSPGQLIVDSGDKLVAFDAVYGDGVTTINGTGSAEFHGEVDNDVQFGPTAGGKLILDQSALHYGDIFGLAAGDAIDLRDFGYVAGKTAEDTTTSVFDQQSGALYVTNGSSDSAPIYLHGDYTAATLTADHLAFQFSSDGSQGTTGGTLVKLVSTA